MPFAPTTPTTETATVSQTVSITEIMIVSHGVMSPADDAAGTALTVVLAHGYRDENAAFVEVSRTVHTFDALQITTADPTAYDTIKTALYGLLTATNTLPAGAVS